MQTYPGKFIVLEGADGSGKTTQFKLLTERLKAVGYDVAVFDFPRYEQPSSYFVKKYLNGDYGPAAQISPYTASLFYALDRYEAANDIRKALEAGKIVLSNRYAGSNMAHQGSKIVDPIEQRSYFVWADSLEYQLLGIPRPNLNIFLRVPAEVSYELISRKAQRSYTTESHDEHEKDVGHLRRSVATYDTLCKLFPKDFIAIECTSDGQILSVPDINDLIWAHLRPLLPPNPKRPGREVTVKLNEQQPAKPSAAEPANQQTERSNIDNYSLLAINQLPLHGVSITLNKYWDHKNGYKFYVPKELTPQQQKSYSDSLAKLAELHKALQKKLGAHTPAIASDQAKYALRATTPMAALAHAELAVAGSFDPDLLAQVAEATSSTEFKKIYRAAHKAFGTPASKLGESSAQLDAKPQALKDIITRLGKSNLTQSQGDPDEPVRLVEARPHNEFDLLADILYLHTSLPLDQINQQLAQWTYDQKLQAFQAALSQNSGALQNASYKFDVLFSWLDLKELFSAGLAQNLRIQSPTVRYGYDVPEFIEEAGVEDEFLACFDESLNLYSALQAAGKEELAGYACLQGHKLRCQFSINALGLLKYQLSAAKDPAPSGLALLIEKVGQAHPVLHEQLLKQAAQKQSGSLRKNSRSRSRSKTHKKP